LALAQWLAIHPRHGPSAIEPPATPASTPTPTHPPPTPTPTPTPTPSSSALTHTRSPFAVPQSGSWSVPVVCSVRQVLAQAYPGHRGTLPGLAYFWTRELARPGKLAPRSSLLVRRQTALAPARIKVQLPPTRKLRRRLPFPSPPTRLHKVCVLVRSPPNLPSPPSTSSQATRLVFFLHPKLRVS